MYERTIKIQKVHRSQVHELHVETSAKLSQNNVIIPVSGN